MIDDCRKVGGCLDDKCDEKSSSLVVDIEPYITKSCGLGDDSCGGTVRHSTDTCERDCEEVEKPSSNDSGIR